MTIQEAVKKIIELRGLDIFKNPKQFFALLGDLSPEYPKELRIIKNNGIKFIWRFAYTFL